MWPFPTQWVSVSWENILFLSYAIIKQKTSLQKYFEFGYFFLSVNHTRANQFVNSGLILVINKSKNLFNPFCNGNCIDQQQHKNILNPWGSHYIFKRKRTLPTDFFFIKMLIRQSMKTLSDVPSKQKRMNEMLSQFSK